MKNLSNPWSREKQCELASYILTVIALLLVLTKGLMVALFTGLITYTLINVVAPVLERHLKKETSKIVAVGFLSLIVVGTLIVATWVLVNFFQSDAGSIQALLQKLAEILETSSTQVPPWIAEHMPKTVDELNAIIVGALREHAAEAKEIGGHIEHIVVQIVFGLLIGTFVALGETSNESRKQVKPLAHQLGMRVTRFTESFQKSLAAQVKISAINTIITALCILIILPLCGISLPFKTTIIIVTFVGGLLPVAGSFIANSLLIVVALSHSFALAIIAAVFMLVIHKLEYFLSAKIIGAAISSKTWEILTAVLVMLTLFGLPGIVAAPFFYAYLKNELVKNNLV